MISRIGRFGLFFSKTAHDIGFMVIMVSGLVWPLEMRVQADS